MVQANMVMSCQGANLKIHGQNLYTIEQAAKLAEISLSNSSGRYHMVMSSIRSQRTYNFRDYLITFISMAAPELVERFLNFIDEYQKRDSKQQRIVEKFRVHTNGDTLIHLEN